MVSANGTSGESRVPQDATFRGDQLFREYSVDHVRPYTICLCRNRGDLCGGIYACCFDEIRYSQMDVLS